ncbi:hypothetical protein AT237_07205 [Bartonella henselae]|nr:hypothetical protein AT237_07205 [Bartonella henselae]
MPTHLFSKNKYGNNQELSLAPILPRNAIVRKVSFLSTTVNEQQNSLLFFRERGNPLKKERKK